jgi:GLPGLI family protein
MWLSFCYININNKSNFMKYFIPFFIFFATLSYSQEFQGKAVYMSKVGVDKSFLDNPRFGQYKGYMEKMLKQNTEKDYVLNFNSTESIYREIEKLDIEDGRGGFNWMAQYIGENIGKLYKNINDKVSINETEFMGRFFLLTDPLEEQKWKMTGESKKIGKYTCYKATYEKEVEEATFSFGNFNQAQNTPKKKKMKKVNVVAWFTPEIPIATGPSRYGGLPGLILEVSDDQTTLLCTKIVMNPTDKVKIKKPKKGKIIATSDFLVLQDEKRIEAREMWQKRRASGSTARLNR